MFLESLVMGIGFTIGSLIVLFVFFGIILYILGWGK